MSDDHNKDEVTAESPPASTSRTFKIMTLRIPPEMHQELTLAAAKMQLFRGKQVSVNSLITLFIEQGIKRTKNPKMLKDFEGL